MLVDFENEKYLCSTVKKEKAIVIEVFRDQNKVYKSKLSLEQIEKQIPAFEDFTIKEIESELNDIKDENIFMEKKMIKSVEIQVNYFKER